MDLNLYKDCAKGHNNILRNLYIMERKHFVSVNISDYTKEGNELFRNKHVGKLSIGTLKLWINRFIIRDVSHKASEWFGGSTENDNYVFWFKLEKDAIRAEKFLQDIKENLIPSHSKLY